MNHALDPTGTLAAHVRGDPQAAGELLPQVYDELRALAARYMRRERAGHTLQPTALVHEAYLRMIDITRIDWQGKTHFFAMAARQMRRILVESARRISAKKRGARPQRITLADGIALTPGPTLDVLALDQALTRLAEQSPRQSEVAELRLFGDLLVEEIAHLVGISVRTVKRDWRVARAWLSSELDTPGKPGKS